MKFIHAADIHLDSPLTGLSAYQDAPVEQLRTATRDAFARLITQAIERAVDFMVIAGDLYDGNWKDHNTGIYFCREMGRLQKAGIPVYLLFGNHDAESEMTRTLQWPDNVFVFDARKPTSFFLDELGVVLHGQSFREAATIDNLAAGYPPPVPGKFNIGVLHTALEGNAAHAHYAPCSKDELHAKGYQYWALGHVHEYQVWEGASTIVFPGNLQGRHIRETGPRGAVLVQVQADSSLHLERLLVDVLRWHHLELDCSLCCTMPDVVRTLDEALNTLAADKPANMPYAVRVTLHGRTEAHGVLFGEELQLRAQVLALAAAIDPSQLWIEKVVLRTQPRLETLNAARTDALTDLQTLLAEAEDDEDFLVSLQEDLMGLVKRMPAELQSGVSYLSDIRQGKLTELISDVRPGLIDYLDQPE